MKPLGQVAYEAAVQAAPFASAFSLDQALPWEQLPELSRQYWAKVEQAVVNAHSTGSQDAPPRAPGTG